jgi:hypothetical protein
MERHAIPIYEKDLKALPLKAESSRHALVGTWLP